MKKQKTKVKGIEDRLEDFGREELAKGNDELGALLLIASGYVSMSKVIRNKNSAK